MRRLRSRAPGGRGRRGRVVEEQEEVPVSDGEAGGPVGEPADGAGPAEPVEIDLDAVLERFERDRRPVVATPSLWPDLAVRAPWEAEEGAGEEGTAGRAPERAAPRRVVGAPVSRSVALVARSARTTVGRLRGLRNVRRPAIGTFPWRRPVLGVGGVVALAVLAVLTVRGLPPGGEGEQPDGTVAGPVPASGPAVVFPAPRPDARGPEERLRPVGVRSLEVGFEAAIIGVTQPPSCASQDAPSERALWFDASASALDAVAPGEHGVAVLLAAAGGPSGPRPFEGIGGIRVGAMVEVARSNGTVLAWRVIDVVPVDAGRDLPLELLVPVAEQRLLLVGCGADVDGSPRDVHVLALRAD